jgi:glycerophosphoryl diester phosphodiesterase
MLFLFVPAAAALYLLNASWLAAPPAGRPTVIAQRGLAQRYDLEDVDDRTCIAGRMLPPSHRFIDNTLPSIEAAFALGADVVEVDVRVTRDHQFVLFHDWDLGCRTDATGPLADRSVDELKKLDVGYGYTANKGNSFPLRGLGLGLMPTLEEALKARPRV